MTRRTAADEEAGEKEAGEKEADFLDRRR